MLTQADRVLAAEEEAAANWCDDPKVEAGDAQAIADTALVWAHKQLGRGESKLISLSIEMLTQTMSWDEWSTLPESELPRGRASLWQRGAEASEGVNSLLTMSASDTGAIAKPTEHLVLHELGHIIALHWPDAWDTQPDPHGPLFARRHLDLIQLFHPQCFSALVGAVS